MNTSTLENSPRNAELDSSTICAVSPGSGFCFRNGAIAVCDKNGHQIPELQIGWPVLWARHAVASGFDPVGTVFETSVGKILIHKTDEDFNWEIL